MSQDQRLRALVIQRLNAAAEEIFGLFERTVAEYEEELCRSKEENERQRELLNAVFKPQLRLHRSDMQPLSVSETGDLLEPQDWSPSLDQEDPLETPDIKQELWSGQEEEQLQELKGDIQQLLESDEPFCTEQQKRTTSEDPVKPPVKEEREELWTNQEGERLQCPEEADLMSTPVHVKMEEDSRSLALHQAELMESAGEDWTAARSSGSDRLFGCFKCGKRFTLKCGLNRHMRIHTGERPFSCSLCGKRFGQKVHLQTHLKCHTGEKPHSCSFCDKHFTHKRSLQRHMRTHTGEKPLCCGVCGQRFTWPYQLKRHECGGESLQQSEIRATRKRARLRGVEDGATIAAVAAKREDRGGPEPDPYLRPDPDDEVDDSSEPQTDDSRD